jgi:predicted O-methyltransferase YrrM
MRPIELRFRALRVWSYLKNDIWLGVKWVFQRTELSNFYYKLEENNISDLVALISTLTTIQPSRIEDFVQEINSDSHVREVLLGFQESHPELRDSEFSLGRRIGWYVFARITKPQLIVETGVHHGMGGLTLLAALHKNGLEGSPGEYIGTDIDTKAGILLSASKFKNWQILLGDSLASLQELHDGSVGLFINDSDHSANYERDEYSAIKDKLTTEAIILGDNCHATSSLREFSRTQNRNFVFFREIPKDHFYPGAGIGISMPAMNPSVSNGS